MQTYVSILLAEILKAIAAAIYQLDIFQATFTGPAATLALAASGVMQSVHDMLMRVTFTESNVAQEPNTNDKIIYILCQQRKKLVAIKFFRSLPVTDRKKLLEDYYMIGTTVYAVDDRDKNGLALSKATVEVIERDFGRI